MMFFCFQHKLVTPYSIKYAGVEWPEKAENLRNKLKKDNITAMVISEMVSTDVKWGLAEHFQIIQTYGVDVTYLSFLIEYRTRAIITPALEN